MVSKSKFQVQVLPIIILLMTMRSNNQENNDEGGDRLGNLPESLLSNILSHLSTKEAVRTSVLSRKWEYKWACIYNLEFNDRIFYSCRRTRKERFSNFVDRVLMHGGGSSIQSFILRCSSNYELSRVHGWISAAIRRNVEKLEIDIWSAALVLPRCIYDSNSLKELKLLSQVTVRVPNDTLFSKLRKIDFNHVILRNQDLSNGKLLLNFPFLESLVMYCCKWRNVTTVKLDAPVLTTFHTTFSSYQFRNKIDGFVFDICGSKLADFKLNGELFENYVLPNPTQVESATIKLFFSTEWIPRENRVGKILRQMNALTYLEISGEVLIALRRAAEIGSLPLFGNLVHLKLYTTYYSFTDGAAVVRLLQRAPVLQTLTMDMSTTVGSDLLYDGSQNDAIPACFSSHLKDVTFLYAFDCLRREEDLGLIKFILRNAKELEIMELISPKSRTFPIPSPEIREKLLSIPTASNAATILFI